MAGRMEKPWAGTSAREPQGEQHQTAVASPGTALLLRVLPVHGVPAGQVAAQAFLGLGGRPHPWPPPQPRRGPPSVLFFSHPTSSFFSSCIRASPGTSPCPSSGGPGRSGRSRSGRPGRSKLFLVHMFWRHCCCSSPGPADAVELDQDAALPLREALQVHPGVPAKQCSLLHTTFW